MHGDMARVASGSPTVGQGSGTRGQGHCARVPHKTAGTGPVNAQWTCCRQSFSHGREVNRRWQPVQVFRGALGVDKLECEWLSIATWEAQELERSGVRGYSAPDQGKVAAGRAGNRHDESARRRRDRRTVGERLESVLERLVFGQHTVRRLEQVSSLSYTAQGAPTPLGRPLLQLCMKSRDPTSIHWRRPSLTKAREDIGC